MKLVRFLPLSLALVIGFGLVQAQQRDSNQSYKDKLLASTQPFKAKISSINPSARAVTVEVKHKGTEVDTQRGQEVDALKQQIVAATRARDWANAARLRGELSQLQSSPYKDVVDAIELQLDESTRIRSYQAGHKIDFSNLKIGQSVEVRLARRKANGNQSAGQGPRVALILVLPEPNR
jgi:hypothetical protein